MTWAAGPGRCCQEGVVQDSTGQCGLKLSPGAGFGTLNKLICIKIGQKPAILVFFGPDLVTDLSLETMSKIQ